MGRGQELAHFDSMFGVQLAARVETEEVGPVEQSVHGLELSEHRAMARDGDLGARAVGGDNRSMGGHQISIITQTRSSLPPG